MRSKLSPPLRLLVAALLATLAPAQSPLVEPLPDGFRPLFDGRSLAGFRGRPQLDPVEEARLDAALRSERQTAWNEDLARHWRVDAGEIINDGNGVYLTTENEFGDFDLVLDYRTVAGADSGVYLRAHPQVQIWDTTAEGGKHHLGADKGSGGLWNNQRHERFPLKLADRPFGSWNRLEIRLVGARTWVRLNGELVVDGVVYENFFDRSKPLPPRGPIQFQTHGGEIRWRRVGLREIPAAEANAILAARDAAGFVAIFDGKSFEGWTGAVDHYEIADGCLRCKPGSGGALHTVKDYADFVVRVEFRLPKGGNNGLAIRYPGHGDPAYDGFCEVQVLDDPDERYRGIKPWQACGSAYGLIPAQRGYLRAQGAWNFYEVRVSGGSIIVELNGSVVTEGDLRAVAPTLSGREHPGRALSSGFFGFAGHSDPVEFRQILVRKL